MELSKMDFKNIIFHDTETTGADPEDRIIESAHIYFDKKGKLEYREDLNKPPLPIKPAAAMTHGYTNKMVANKPAFEETESFSFLSEKSKDATTYYVAHNSPFDIGMLSKEGIEWDPQFIIDTLKVSQHLYQDSDEVEMFKLQYFRYLFEFDDQDWFQEAMDMFGLTEIKPHTALSDIFILWLFYAKMKTDFNLSNDEMVRLSQTPVLEKKIKFGNIFPKKDNPKTGEKAATYEGIVLSTYKKFGKDTPGYEYLDWAANNMSLSADREYSIKHALAYGVLFGTMPTEKYKSYLYWGIVFVFSTEEIEQALSMLKQDSSFKRFLFESSVNKFENFKATLPMELDAEQEEELKKKSFFNNFVMKYRKDFLV